MKKYLAILLSVVLMLSLAVPAMAADDGTYKITITNTIPGHEYSAYQIFAGDLSDDGKTLSNIKWGTGVNPDAEGFPYAGKTAAEVADDLSTPDQADAFAAALNPYLTNLRSYVVVGANQTSCQILDLLPGYYLVKNTAVPNVNGSYTDYIVVVVGDAKMHHKNSVPSVDKQVLDVDEETGNGDWGDSADYDIDTVGDYVHYKIIATLPSDYELYTTYKLEFSDTMHSGLNLVGIKDLENIKNYVRVMAEEVPGKADVDITEYFTITAQETYNSEGKLSDTYLKVSIEDLNSIPEDVVDIQKDVKIVVYYNCILNEDAVAGEEGNKNAVHLKYSNDPNVNTSTGTATEDNVYVYTYNLNIDKVNGSGEPLTGAEFKLEKMELQTNYDNYDALKDYPNANNENKEVNLQNMKWRPIEASVDATGTQFTFKGVSDGWYRLTETKTPDGYNTIEPVYFVIDETHDETNNTTELTTILTNDKGIYLTDEATGANKSFAAVGDGGINVGLVAEVINNAGATLPETGGMGTTIFYTVGGIMVAAAAILLVTKKRMGAEG